MFHVDYVTQADDHVTQNRSYLPTRAEILCILAN